MDLEKFKKTGNFQLSSGLQSNIFYDLKEAMGEPEMLDKMVEHLQEKITVKPDIIIGIEFGGIPLAVALSMKMNIPFAIIRKRKNTHGMGKRIEGCQKKGTVLLVDDVLQSGRSMYRAKDYLEMTGYKVIQNITVIERDLNGDLL